MASSRKRGQNSYLIVVSRGYDYGGTGKAGKEMGV